MDHLIAVLSAIAIVGGWMVAILGLAINATRHVTQINLTLKRLRETDEKIVKSLHSYNKRFCNIEVWISKRDRRFKPINENDL